MTRPSPDKLKSLAEELRQIVDKKHKGSRGERDLAMHFAANCLEQYASDVEAGHDLLNALERLAKDN